MSAPQLESLMVAIMSLLHALYRQDPNGVPDNASDYAAAEPAPDNESLVGMERSNDCIVLLLLRPIRVEFAARRVQRASIERVEALV